MTTAQPHTTLGSIPRVLSIAGTDPTGGAGVQADLKAILAADGFGMSVITALVAQNTHGVREIHTPPLEFLDAQFRAVADDVTVDAIKIGMLGDAPITDAVTAWLPRLGAQHVVLDPVMVATSGHRLLTADAENKVRELARLADVITPNLPELAVLTNTPVADTLEQATETAKHFVDEYGTAVVVKGGHLTSRDHADNVAVTATSTHRVSTPRIDTKNTHGTGCSLSSALATRLGHGDSLPEALEWSTSWLREAIAAADALNIGTGRGPVDHGARARRLLRLSQDGHQES